MEIGLGILTFGTLGIACAAGAYGSWATEKRRQMDLPKSTLAADAPNTRSGH